MRGKYTSLSLFTFNNYNDCLHLLGTNNIINACIKPALYRGLPFIIYVAVVKMNSIQSNE